MSKWYQLNMLNYHDFQPYEPGNQPLFRFKKLKPVDEEQGLYACTQSNEHYRVSLFNNHHQVALLHALTQKGVFGNIRGFFKRKNMYYCFSDVDHFQTLAEYVQRQRGNKGCLSQQFCLLLIESLLEKASICEEVGCTIKILDPFKLMMKENGEICLVYPFCHSILEGLTCEVVKEEAEFCAPEILILMKNEYDLIRKTFPKAVIYSLGIILLFCFGYRIKSEERILALKNGKEFSLFLKAIRKEIKFLLDGKFISKLIKILMESSDLVRDTIQTFSHKLCSPHLLSLRKYIFNQREPSSGDAYIPTIYSDYSQKLNKSGLNRTIQIQGSAATHTNKSQMSSPNNVNMSSNLYATFRKSPQGVVKNNLGEVKRKSFQIKESFGKSKTKDFSSQHSIQKKQYFQEEKMEDQGTPSPVEIVVDWDELQKDDSAWTSQKKSVASSAKSSKTHVSKRFSKNEPLPSIKDEGQINEDMVIVVTQLGKEKQKFKYPDQKFLKNSNTGGLTLSKSRKKQDNEDKPKLIHKEPDSEIQLKENIILERKISEEESSKNFHKKYMGLVEEVEEPEIIRYCEQNCPSPLPKLSRKKTSSGSVDLQAMTIIEELDDGDDENIEEEELIEPAEERGGSHYVELKEDLNKKSEAVFIVMLISFLIYKIIDFMID